jgi:hypothetical protein
MVLAIKSALEGLEGGVSTRERLFKRPRALSSG